MGRSWRCIMLEVSAKHNNTKKLVLPNLLGLPRELLLLSAT